MCLLVVLLNLVLLDCMDNLSIGLMLRLYVFLFLLLLILHLLDYLLLLWDDFGPIILRLFNYFFFLLLIILIFFSNLLLYLLLMLLWRLLSCSFGLQTVITNFFSIVSISPQFFHLQATFLNPLEDRANDRFWIKPMNLLDDIPFSIVYGSIGEGSAPNILLTMLGIPHAIEVVYPEAPLFFMLQLVHYDLQVPAVPAIR